MIAANALSCHSNHSSGKDEDNTNNCITIPNKLFISLIDLDLQRTISNGYTTDTYTQHILSDIKNSPGWNSTVDNDITIMDFKGRHYVPADLRLHRQILHSKHDCATAGHPGVLATTIAIMKEFYWPGLRSFVRNYIAGCLECQ